MKKWTGALLNCWLFFGGSAQASGPWDVNDISVLFPLEQGLMPVLDSQTQLISRSQYSTLLDTLKNQFKQDYRGKARSSVAGHGNAKGMHTLDNWKVIGFRLDPCFQSHKFNQGNCIPQMRLVVQPVQKVGRYLDAMDFALHLTYSMESGKNILFYLDKLIALRSESEARENIIGKPLGVHPLLERQGNDGSYGRGLKNFIQTHLHANRNLTGITVAFAETQRTQPWIFFGSTVSQGFATADDHSIFSFNPTSSPIGCKSPYQHICRVKKSFRNSPYRDPQGMTPNSQVEPTLEWTEYWSGRYSPWVMPAVGNERRVFLSGRPHAQQLGKVPFSIPVGADKPFMDDFLDETDMDFAREKGVELNPLLARRDYAKKWEGVFNQIENPILTLADDTNCVSCHRTTQSRLSYAQLISMNVRGVNGYQGDGSCTDGVKLGRFSARTFNIRNFGYTHEAAAISQRVVNETLEACKRLKAIQ